MVQCRAVLVAGWSDFTASTSCIEVLNAHEGTVFLAQSVNHEWLFPRMQCIVHHCGMGTMGAVLRSGTPSIPCPKVYDQLKLAKLLVDHAYEKGSWDNISAVVIRVELAGESK